MVQQNNFKVSDYDRVKERIIWLSVRSKRSEQSEFLFGRRTILWPAGNERLRQDHALETDCW